MNVYASDIAAAALSFPFIAAAITAPYLIFQYRRLGSVPWLRTLAVYSFVFYLLCAYFLVLLPLPADRSAIVPYAQTPQLLPFNFVREFLAETSFRADDPATWLPTLGDPYVYEAFFNVLLLVPLGMYLRYYFRRTWLQTLAIGFLVTLSFETTQLTGLWGWYEHPYRLFDVDDLILNALGAMVGFWAAGPALRMLPDLRLVDEEAREAGLRAGALRRALSFGLDLAAAIALIAAATALLRATGAYDALAATRLGQSGTSLLTGAPMIAAVFGLAPALGRGQTPGQRLLKLRTVRPDASPARWYQHFARYGLLFLFILAPPLALQAAAEAAPHAGGEAGALALFAYSHRTSIVALWLAFLGAWAATLVARAAWAAAKDRPFVMLNGLLSNTRVMTVEGVRRQRERRIVLDVAQVGAVERLIAQDGTSLRELMERAGAAVAEAVRARVPDPAPVVVLTGSGNNGGDGWVAGRLLAEAGYPVTLVAPDLAERLHAEPARTAAMEAFAEAAVRNLPLRVLVAPDADILSDALDAAKAVVDALLGTGFSGDEVRQPYAAWIEAANRRRFEGARAKGRGRHRKRTAARGSHEKRPRKALPPAAKDAPFAVAADVPSGLSAQTGIPARPCFAADVTVTMIAFKPGLLASRGAGYAGIVRLASLVDAKPYLARLGNGRAAAAES